MTLSTGTRLGPYEILSSLGAGGMGEVYRAKDTKLGRDVAIKVLPGGFSEDEDRRKRFEREARTLATLNHPGIAAIYSFEEISGRHVLAMELLEGETLRELLAEGALPTKKLLGIAAQVVDGLAKAHEAGIVHRDLKPDNVMITRDGHAKILDFGLAKLVQPEEPEGERTHTPTVSKGTEPGVVMGTVAYMSPEQALGRPLDFRSDQFSFGSMLYEMLTGKKAFGRASSPETMTAVIREEPEAIAAVSPKAAVSLRWIVERCLAKDPAERYASTRDLARDLAFMRDHVSEIAAEAAPVALARRLGWFGPALIAGLMVAAALAVVAVLQGRRPAPAQPVRFAVPVPSGATYSPTAVSRGFAISPDGTRLVIEAAVKGRQRLFLRPLESDKVVELEGTAGAETPFWSPDGRFIAFFADGVLKKIPAAGGPPEALCPASFDIVGSWSREGTILFSQMVSGSGARIFRVAAGGGEARGVLPLDPSGSDVAEVWPHFLPDGRRFLYLGWTQGLPLRELRVASLDSKETHVVSRLEARAEYTSPGYLLYVREATLFAQRFDVRSARLRGEPVPVAENVHHFFGPGHASFSVSQTGVLAYQTGPPLCRLLWLNRAGLEVGTLGEPGVFNGFRISPDGEKVAVAIEDRRTGTSDVWLLAIPSGVSTRLHFDPVDESSPVWSPDGSKVLYRSDRKGVPDLYELTVNAPGSEKRLLEQPGVQQPEDVSRDGRLLVYDNAMTTTAPEVWLLPLSGDPRPVRWLPSRFAQKSPRLSPDGRWIAYESDESGDPEIYVALTDGGGQKERLSREGGRLPRWRRDGREIYFIAPDGFLMAVPLAFGERLRPAAPVRLLHLEGAIENYDVSPDGSRFLVSTPLEKVRESPIRVIVNWPALLKAER